MNSLAIVRRFMEDGDGQIFLQKLYGESASEIFVQRERYLLLARRFEAIFPDSQDVEVCSAPGRTEVGGNHTDHENGHVLAAAVNLDTVGMAATNDSEVIRIYSEGYDPIEIDLGDQEPRLEEQNTSLAMVRGICQYLRRNGNRVRGFNAVLNSTVPDGSGLSSSASFEILIAQIINVLFNQGRLTPLTLAQAGHFSEVEYFNKPCGLMDQMASAVGGMTTMDFADPSKPVIRQIHYDLESSGHVLIITRTGGSHAGLTHEYAAIKEENHEVAQFFGESVLCKVNEGRFHFELPRLREQVGDRAVLRAIHFFKDNRRVLEQVDALEAGDFDCFLALVKESGQSSWTLLQNCFSCKNPADQAIPLGLTLSAHILGKRGAWRVHGGGFAGTVQAFVPKDLLKKYLTGMEQVFGYGACLQLRVRAEGVTSLPVQA